MTRDEAWVRFAAGAANANIDEKYAARYADEMLAEYDERFTVPSPPRLMGLREPYITGTNPDLRGNEK